MKPQASTDRSDRDTDHHSSKTRTLTQKQGIEATAGRAASPLAVWLQEFPLAGDSPGPSIHQSDTAQALYS